MWENKRKDQTRTRDITEFGLKMPTSPGLSTSNNWGWAETLKNSFTLVELGFFIQKWATKPIGNKSNNTLKKMSDNTLKIRSEWQHTQEKGEHYSSRKVSTTAQKPDYKKTTKDQVGRIERS
jgi:hypothetical protein